jgi:hypothetical protein
MDKAVILFFHHEEKKGHEVVYLYFPSWFSVDFVVKMIVFGQVLSVESKTIKN